jgi:hypothetical protein
VDLGFLSLPLWLLVVVLTVTRLGLNLNETKNTGDMQMKDKTSKTVSFKLTSSSIAEVVWDIGAKVAAA